MELKGDLMFVGDLSINVNEKQDGNVLNFLKTLQENNLQQKVVSSTHIKGGILDLVIVDRSIDESGTNTFIDQTFHTDHYPILIKCF